MEIKYWCLHIPTNTRIERVGVFLSRRHFLEDLNKWNIIGGQLWKYWE
jgi:hypothetical protein